MRLCSKITVLLLCACGSPSVSAQVVARFAGRHMLAEIAGNVSSTEQFDVRALHASLDLEMGPVEDVPAGNYTLENTAADVRRTLENPETINRHIKIQPGINVIVLEDLNVPSSTVNTVNCRLATLDLRKSGLDASQFASIFNCIVILPSQLTEANGAPHQWTIQNSHILTPCEDETPAVRLENSTLAELTSSVPSRPEILVNNSTVRCLLDGHVDQYVEYLQGLQGSVESPADPETTDAKANENTGWLLPLIIITAVFIVVAITALNIYLCCCRATCTRPVMLYTDPDRDMFPPPPTSDHQHGRIKSIRDSSSCTSALSGVTESDKFYPPHWKTSELNPQTGRHAGASGGLYMQEIGTRGSSTRGSSSAKSGKSKSVIFDLGLHTRMPLRSEDSCSPPGSVCASTPKFIGLKAVIVAPSSAGKYDPGGIHSSDKLVPAEVSDTPPGPTLEEQNASAPVTSAPVTRDSSTITWDGSHASANQLRSSFSTQMSVSQHKDSTGSVQRPVLSVESSHLFSAIDVMPPRATKPTATVSRVSATRTIVSERVKRHQSSPAAPSTKGPQTRAQPVQLEPQQAKTQAAQPQPQLQPQRARAQPAQPELQRSQDPLSLVEHSELSGNFHNRKSLHALSPKGGAAATSQPPSPYPSRNGKLQTWEPSSVESHCTAGMSGGQSGVSAIVFDCVDQVFSTVRSLEDLMRAESGEGYEGGRKYNANYEPDAMLATMDVGGLDSLDEQQGFPGMPMFGSFEGAGSDKTPTDALMEANTDTTLSGASHGLALWHTCKAGIEDENYSGGASTASAGGPAPNGPLAPDGVSGATGGDTARSTSYYSDCGGWLDGEWAMGNSGQHGSGAARTSSVKSGGIRRLDGRGRGGYTGSSNSFWRYPQALPDADGR